MKTPKGCARLREAFEYAIGRGWVITPHKGHFQFRKLGCGLITSSGSPGCPHAAKNVIRDLQRAENGRYTKTLRK